MTDRRRKRKPTNSSTDDTVKDFHAVDPVQARRSSDWGDHESRNRHESWMSKVSLAMSTRIFSGGKKLGGSRSTQVLPISVADNSKTSVGSMSSSSMASLQEPELQQAPSRPMGSQQTLRLVASEKSLGSSTDATGSPVTTFGACPSVTCDVASDDSDDSSRDDDCVIRLSSRGSTSHRRGNSRRQRSSAVQKVRPGEEDDEEDAMFAPTQTRVMSISSREAQEDGSTEVNVQDAAPILKGFFSKSVSLSTEQRQRQREQRREALYRESKQRQDNLREQTERERLVSEESSRRRKVGQLRRLNQQRRIELLRDAASARETLLVRIQEDNDLYHAERERWGNDFEDEMHVLSEAFKKARTTDANRPMTVAGLAVPVAISQLERDASNFEKRVKTAQPALANTQQRRAERPSTTGVTPSSLDVDLSSSPFFESCEVFTLGDSIDVLDLFGGDDQASDISPSKIGSSTAATCTQQPDLDIDQLLGEREKLLQRLAVIDQMVQQHQQ
uniref:Uncharacterized protein n=1 Tax=Phytophthora ramorum TaxID=164328 RepID=H3GZI1_PHYRM